MKYSDYPEIDHAGMYPGEVVIQRQLLLIEKVQRELWGNPINGGNILKPMDPQLTMNWIAGGIFQYNNGSNIISSTYALSRPDGDPFIDENDQKWSGIGYEYFIEVNGNSDWAVSALVNIASHIYSKQSNILFPGMIISAESGFIPYEINRNKIHLLSVVGHIIEMPDGRCEYLQLVPLTDSQLNEYKKLGNEKSKTATEWYSNNVGAYCVEL